MARTFYESSKDLDEEKSVANFLSSKWNLTFYKLKPSYKVDWVIFKDGQISTVAEIKGRHVKRLAYDTLMLSLDKWMTGKAMAAEMKVPFMLLIKWDDGLFWYKAGVSPVTYGFGGRKDRQDPQDMEPVVFIPVRHFKEIK